MAKEFAWLATSTGVYQASNLAANILLAGVLDPAGYGDWVLLMVIANYLSALQMGVLNAMNRDVPLFLGAGDPGRVRLIQRVALGGVAMAAALGAVVLLFIPPGWISLGMPVGAVRAAAGYIVAFQLFTYAGTYLRSLQRFYAWGWQQLGMTVSLGLMLLGASWRGLSGALMGQSLGLLGVGTLALYLARANLRVSVLLGPLVQMVRVGLPIMLVGLGHVVLTTIDRWVVARYLGSAAVGQYSLLVRVVSVSVLVCGIVADQVYPRAAEAFGRRRDARDLMPYLRMQVIATFGLTLVGNAFLFLVVPPVVTHFLPDYAAALPVLPILLVGLFFLPQCMVFGILLNILDRQRVYLVIQVCATLFGFGLSVALTRSPLGIRGTALAASITYALYLGLLIAFSRSAMRAAVADRE